MKPGVLPKRQKLTHRGEVVEDEQTNIEQRIREHGEIAQHSRSVKCKGEQGGAKQRSGDHEPYQRLTFYEEISEDRQARRGAEVAREEAECHVL
jgi:hypothetical protein